MDVVVLTRDTVVKANGFKVSALRITNLTVLANRQEWPDAPMIVLTKDITLDSNGFRVGWVP